MGLPSAVTLLMLDSVGDINMNTVPTFKVTHVYDTPWKVVHNYADLPEEAKEDLWDGVDENMPSPHPHFYVEAPCGFHHTSEFIPITEGHVLHGSGYLYYSPDYYTQGPAVLAIDSNGGHMRGYFTYA